jgi:hypothetical protein
MSAIDDVREQGERPARSPWRLILIGAVVLVVLVAAGLITRWSLESSRTAEDLRAVQAELDESDPSWRLQELEDARERVPEKDNSARVIVAVARLLPKGGLPISKGDTFDNLRPPARLDAEQEALLKRDLASVAPALALARKLADMPRGRHEFQHAFNPIATLLPDVQKTREAAALLRYDVLLRAQQKDMAGALESCRAVLNAARSLGDEPFFISQLVRIACVAIGCGMVEWALSQGEATDDDLARLQAMLAEEERHPTLLIGLRGERAMIDDLFTKMASGRLDLQSLLGNDPQAGPDWKARFFAPSKATIRREHARCLKMLTRLTETTRLPEHEQIDEEKKMEAEVKALPRDAALTKMLLPAVYKVGDACRRKTGQVRCLMVLLAVERYRLKKKAWPAKLEEVVSAGLLGAVPRDPYDGKPLRYAKRADGVTVYSVGPDGTDNGGNLDRARFLEPGTDQGFRLWDVKARRAPPVPRPPKPPAEWHPGER